MGLDKTLLNGFIPIPNRIPKKRKKPILVESESPAEQEKKESVTSPNVAAYENTKRLLFQFKKTETPDKEKQDFKAVILLVYKNGLLNRRMQIRISALVPG
jgi:hypothetical protein